MRALLALAVALAPGLVAAQAAKGASKGNPRLSALSIQIWPEYDRPAALVILNGELPVGSALPAPLSLRIAAASGGPHAVAASTGQGATLFNVPYERKNADDFITLKFDAPQRFFHIEFYEPIATGSPERNFTYVWPGDLAADRVEVVLQQPAAATGVTVQPALDAVSVGNDGLSYRAAELGALAAGTSLPITVRYTKTDARFSSEIMKTKAPEKTPDLASLQGALQGAVPPPTSGAASAGLPGWALAVTGVVGVLAVLAAVAFSRWRWRRKMAAAPVVKGRFCAKCGATPAAGDKFCAKCGARLA